MVKIRFLLAPLVLCVSLLAEVTRSQAVQELRIAWFAPKEEFMGVSASTSVNVFKYALKSIETSFLKGISIRVKWYDTKCDPKAALAAAVDARQGFDPHLFLGPPCSAAMKGVAMLGSHWNIPVFGWVCNAHDFVDRSIYSTLVRVLAPLNQFSSTMNFVTILFRWRRFATIFDENEAYSSVNDAIVLYLREKNTTVSSQTSVKESMTVSEVEEIFTQIRKYARVIVFSVPWMTMRKYMLVAHRLGMTDGDFAFICINGDVYTSVELHKEVLSDAGWRRNDSHDNDARVAFESVIHVIMDTSNFKVYEKFKQYVSMAATLQPETWELPQGDETMDAYAPLIYDATVFWSVLVNRTLKEGGDPRNGTHIFQIARGVESEGVTGPLVMDHNCDRLSNIWFLDMQRDGKFQSVIKIYYTLNGVFLETIQTEVDDGLVLWRDGTSGSKNAPPDTPPCGFEGEKCQMAMAVITKRSYTDSIVGAAAGSTVVFLLAVVVQVSLRRYRRRRQLESMIWQVKFEEVDFVTAILSETIRASFRNLASRRTNSSKKLLKSTKRINLEQCSDLNIYRRQSDNGAVMFGSVAYFRGTLVSVKRISNFNFNLTKEHLQQLNKLMELKHQNITAFVGACVDPGRVLLLWEYCAKGSLQDVIWNQNIQLDHLFKFALCQDVAKGLEYIHKSSVNHHGNMKSSNCVVDSRWTCKLTDFGVPNLRAIDKGSLQLEDNTFWTAPEMIRSVRDVDMQKADVFALGVLLKEVFTRTAPYSEYVHLNSEEIMRRVMTPDLTTGPFRPSLNNDIRSNQELCQLIADCWAEDPDERPSATRALKTLNRLNPSKHVTMIDNMLAMLEKYANHLEELVAERTSELDHEKRKTENLLYRMLPQSVAEDLKLGKPVKAELFDQATIYFSDIVGFTTICSESTPIEVVNLLNSLYTLFDDIITRYDVYKVETIGDAYMLASGLPKRNGVQHIKEIANAALDILASIRTFTIPHRSEQSLKIRIGIHTGPVVAGVVGLAMPRYCLFGDAVNTASRMESTGLPLRIHMSSSAKDQLDNFKGFNINYRGEIEVKGKGVMQTYFLLGREGFYKTLPDPAGFVDSPARRPTNVNPNSCQRLSYDRVATEHRKQTHFANDINKNESSVLRQTQQHTESVEASPLLTSKKYESPLTKTDDTQIVLQFSEGGSDQVAILISQSGDDLGSHDVPGRSRESCTDVPDIENQLHNSGSVPQPQVTTNLQLVSKSPRTPHQEISETTPNRITYISGTGTTDGAFDILKLATKTIINKASDSFNVLKLSSETKLANKLKDDVVKLENSTGEHISSDDDHALAEKPAKSYESNPLEYLFRNPKAADSNNVSPKRNHDGSNNTTRSLEIKSNIFPHGLKTLNDRLQVGGKDRKSASQAHYGQPKMENTEHSNSPVNSRASSPKLDLIKEEVNSRMLRAMEITPL